MPKKVPQPMDTPGFGWRVGLTILSVLGWLIFSIVWLLFYASSFDIYQNIAAIIVSLLVVGAILASSWASWGINYGRRYGKEWEKSGKNSSSNQCCEAKVHTGGCGGAVYGLGFIGALVYYITTAPTLWLAVVGFFKAIFWPAFLVYGALKTLGL
jgi:hypothetical protein